MSDKDSAESVVRQIRPKSRLTRPAEEKSEAAKCRERRGFL